MRTIIAGSRSITDPDVLECAMMSIPWPITKVISGGARGVDALGERWARGMGIPLDIYRAEWEVHGKAAGPIRNRKMAENADALVAVWDGESRGTGHMIATAEKMGLRVHIYTPATPPDSEVPHLETGP